MSPEDAGGSAVAAVMAGEGAQGAAAARSRRAWLMGARAHVARPVSQKEEGEDDVRLRYVRCGARSMNS